MCIYVQDYDYYYYYHYYITTTRNMALTRNMRFGLGRSSSDLEHPGRTWKYWSDLEILVGLGIMFGPRDHGAQVCC